MIGRDAAWFTPPDDPNEWLRDRSYDLSSELFGEGKSACTLEDAIKALEDVPDDPDDPHIYEWAETLRDITNENLKDMEDAA